MYKYLYLTKRNCLVFLRDRSAVFFSLLSMLIVLILMGVFLGDMNVENITNLLKQYGEVRDAATDKENAQHLVQYWTLSGILVVNAVTVTLTVIGTMVNDTSENRLNSFYSSPVSKVGFALSYITAAVLIGFLFCMLTLFVALFYITYTGGAMLSVAALGQIALYTLINVCIFSIIMYLGAIFVKSNSAWSGVATIVGTLVGFVGAIYLPMGNLPESVGNVLKYLPVLHGASVMRKICCADAMELTFLDTPKQLTENFQEHMGITVVMNGKVVSSNFSIFFLLVCGMIALGAVIFVLYRKNISDR